MPSPAPPAVAKKPAPERSDRADAYSIQYIILAVLAARVFRTAVRCSPGLTFPANYRPGPASISRQKSKGQDLRSVSAARCSSFGPYWPYPALLIGRGGSVGLAAPVPAE